MQNWKQVLKKSVTAPSQLSQYFRIDEERIARVIDTYPMRVNPYYLSLIKTVGDPLWKQAVPDLHEFDDKVCFDDPLNEENLSPVPNLVHKYPDRVLFLVNHQCAMYCRFCTRKRKVGTAAMWITDDTLRTGFDYIRNKAEIRDVLVSGGDPLLLDDERLEWILSSLRAIPHVEIIRIGSRVPCTLPMRVTVRLAALLKRYHPLYINTHFNHPAEITPQSEKACSRLANAGIPLGNQTVLLRGVNDDPETIKTLMHMLLRIRVKPYYLFQGDMTKGTDHFRTPVNTGIDILRSLTGFCSGMAIPTLAVDLPGGYGKIPLSPDYIAQKGATLRFVNYRGEFCSYQDVDIV